MTPAEKHIHKSRATRVLPCSGGCGDELPNAAPDSTRYTCAHCLTTGRGRQVQTTLLPDEAEVVS
jgi:hypothetical protein